MLRLATSTLLAAVIALATAGSVRADDEDAWGGRWSEPGPPPPGGEEIYPAQPAEVNVDLTTPGNSVTLQTFRDGLAPYGEWVHVRGFGRVWRPMRVASGWRPYYYGRWEWTDEGWLWVSDEPWGWAAYHYGRWAYDGVYGWFWVPGYQWAPAWVSWRYGSDYIGWAPLAPGFSVYVTSYPVHYGWWNFVPSRRFVGYPVHRWAYTGGRAQSIFHDTRPAPPRSAYQGAPAPAWGGPARPWVERSVGHTIAPVRLQPVASPAAIRAARASGVVPVFRPAPAPRQLGSSAVAPSRRPGSGSAAPAPATPLGRPGSASGSPAPAPGRPGASSPLPAMPSRPGSALPAPAPSRPQMNAAPPSPGPRPSGGFDAPRPSVTMPRPGGDSGGAAPRPAPSMSAPPRSAAPAPAPRAMVAPPPSAGRAPVVAPRVQARSLESAPPPRSMERSEPMRPTGSSLPPAQSFSGQRGSRAAPARAREVR